MLRSFFKPSSPLRAALFRKLRNRYVLALIIAVVWMAFFDSFDLRSQLRMRSRIGRLEEDKAYYQTQIEKLRRESALLQNNKAEIEKLARENYLMKRKNEDLYVLTHE